MTQKIYGLFFLLLISADRPAAAQNTSDCTGAIAIFGNSTITFRPQGEGDVRDLQLPGNGAGCIQSGGENGSVWYKIYVGKGGSLTFSISPQSPSDYDWAVWGPFEPSEAPCGRLGNPVRCSAAAPTTATGLNFSSNLVSGPPGSSNPWNSAMEVRTGQVYYIMIDNWSANGSSFDLKWGGTAELSQLAAGFSEKIKCNSVMFTNLTSTIYPSVTYRWDFGDGKTSNQKSPSHKYDEYGIYNVSLTVSATDGNTSVEKKTVDVTLAEPASLPLLQSAYDADDPKFQLGGQPAGGRFSVNGSAATAFNPAEIGVGTHKVEYTYTDAEGCESSTFKMVEIKALPVPKILNLAAEYCVNDPAVTLEGSPAGGYFRIAGKKISQINPEELGVGEHEVEYVYTDPKRTVTNSRTFRILDLTKVEIANLHIDSLREDADPLFMLGSPPGGVFSANNRTITHLNPSELGLGSHIITYTYTEPNACTTQAGFPIKIYPLPVLSWENLDEEYCGDTAPFDIQASPPGGVMSIAGKETFTFNAAELPVGLHQIIYTYTDAGNKPLKLEKEVRIKPVPVVSFTNLGEEYCANQAVFTLAARPAGGIFTVGGSVVTQFKAKDLVPGVHRFSYTFTNPEGCGKTIYKDVIIKSLPQISFVRLREDYCIDDHPTFEIETSPAGLGTVTINGRSGRTFSPAGLGPGTHTVAFSFTDTLGCTNRIEQLVSLHANPVFSLNGQEGDGCYATDTLHLLTDENLEEHRILWSGPGLLSRADSTSIVVNKLGTYILTLTDKITGCATTDSAKVLIYPIPVLDLADIPYLCFAETKILTSPEHFRYFWKESASGRKSTERDFPAWRAGDYVLTVWNEFGCSDTDTIHIQEVMPKIFVEIGNDSTICENETSALLTAGPGFTNYEWSYENTDIWESTGSSEEFRVFELGTWRLRITDSLGCQESDTLNVTDCCKPRVEIPNAFSPAVSEGVNDNYLIKHLDIKQFKMQIFNRWGQLVFETEDTETPWDGTAGGKAAPAGAYRLYVEYWGCHLLRPYRRSETKVIHLVE